MRIMLCVLSLACVPVSSFGMASELFQAVSAGDIATLERILGPRGQVDRRFNLDVRGADVFGITLLHNAVSLDHAAVVQWLLDSGADVNATDSGEMTPLMVAVLEGRRVLISLLIAHGADKTIRDGRGLSAVDYARIDFPAALELLEQWGMPEFLDRYDKKRRFIPTALQHRAIGGLR